MITNYTSIQSILYNLSLVIDERYWNETAVLEWATHALRSLRIEKALQQKVCQLTVTDHKATLPADLVYLIQVAYYRYGCPNNDCPDLYRELALPENSELPYALIELKSTDWEAMRMTSNPYHGSICLDKSLVSCRDCKHEFGVAPSMVLTTTLPMGLIMVSYLAWPVDDDGYALIPDDETVKEALFHYVLYRYWLSKYTMKEEGSEQRMNFHLTMWDTLSKKALNLNLPDVSTIENLKNVWNRLVPRDNRFDQLFTTIASRENVSH